jgi:RNA polymerase sigma-70 factor (ECF subfamily)
VVQHADPALGIPRVHFPFAIEVEMVPMAGRESFERILSAAQAGDGDAFGRLYESLNRRVRTYVSYRGAADPEGMVNDVFLRVFTRLTDFHGGETQFAAWVFTIARNMLIDEARRRDRRPTGVAPSDLEGAGEAGGDVEAEALARLGDEWVVEQLDRLTPDQRDVIVLRVVGDLTVEDVADILGKGAGAVKAMQRRALRTLARNSHLQAVPK